MLVGVLGTNFNENFIKSQQFPFKNASENVWKTAAIVSRPQCHNNLVGIIQAYEHISDKHVLPFKLNKMINGSYKLCNYIPVGIQ